MKPVKFWSTTGDYGCFSNFSRHEVVIENKRYKTTEHFYQSQKFATTDPLYANKIAKAATPKDAAHLGRDKKRNLRQDWESTKLDVMRKALRAKVEQHADIRELLLSTGYKNIVEDSPYDPFWGSGADGSGHNWLGKLWMELRAELRGENEETDEEFVDAVFGDLTPRSLKPRVWSRRRGAPKPPKGAVYVGRPTKWGNKFPLTEEDDRDSVIKKYEEWLCTQPSLVSAAKTELRGKHLVCWCTDSDGNKLPCHADVLLRIANEDSK